MLHSEWRVPRISRISAEGEIGKKSAKKSRYARVAEAEFPNSCSQNFGEATLGEAGNRDRVFAALFLISLDRAV